MIGGMIRLPTTDDRGRRTRVRWWRGFIRTGIGPWLRLWKPLTPLFIMLALVAAMGALAMAQGPWVMILLMSSPAISIVLTAFLTLTLIAARSGRVVLREAIRRVRIRSECPSCGYDMGELEPQVDGVTQCPECGSAWRIGPEGPDVTIVVAAISQTVP
jgi:predicted Zn-ribbon and HTH transcriptional regulator